VPARAAGVATRRAYLSAWSERDPSLRAELVERAWAPDGRLIDPPLTGEGHDGISEMAGAMQEHYAGHSFRRASDVDAHHDHLRFAWELVGPDGEVALTGLTSASSRPTGGCSA
jgi:hypothetical protein